MGTGEVDTFLLSPSFHLSSSQKITCPPSLTFLKKIKKEKIERFIYSSKYRKQKYLSIINNIQKEES